MNLRKPKNVLYKLKLQDPTTQVLKTSYSRYEIEKLLIKQNRYQFSKARNITAYKDKIIKALHKDNVRDKILNVSKDKSDVNSASVYKFL